MTRLTRATSPAALVISVLALIVATSAGSAYAATKIGTKQIKDNAVTSKKIKNRTITSNDLAAGTVRSLRGAPGPVGAQGPAGPQGPGSTTFDRTIVVNGTSQNVALPFGAVNLLCNLNQVRVQVDVASSNLNGTMVAGTYGVNDDPAKTINLTSGSGFPVNDNSSKMWLDLQVSDRASGATGTLRVHGYRENGSCRWIGQYVP